MSEYYAIIRSNSELQHYGVRGMKWGVRRAIDTGNQKKLDKHFQKAAKKLAKLQDIGLNPKKYAAKATAYGAAAAGTGTIAGNGLWFRYNYRKVSTPYAKKAQQVVFDDKDLMRSPWARGAVAAATVGLAAKSAQNAYRAANASKYRQKAVNFREAMNDAFKGTKYQNKYVAMPVQNQTKKRRKSK